MGRCWAARGQGNEQKFIIFLNVIPITGGYVLSNLDKEKMLVVCLRLASILVPAKCFLNTLTLRKLGQKLVGQWGRGRLGISFAIFCSSPKLSDALKERSSSHS